MLSRLQFRGRRTIQTSLLVLRMFPSLLLLIAVLYVLMALGIVNTLLGVIVVALSFRLPGSTFIIRNFFDGIPRDVENSTLVDGCTRFGAFRQVIIFMIKPGITSIAVFSFLSAWSNFILFNTLLFGNRTPVMATYIRAISRSEQMIASYNVVAAMGIIYMLPVIVFFVISQKQLMKVIDDVEKVKVNEEEIADFMPDVCRKLDWLSKEDLIKRMVSHEFNRFVEYYRDREEIETVGTNEEKKAGKGKKNGSRKAEAGFTRLFINVGKTDNFFPTDLIGLINSNTKGRVDLGRIDLMRNFSFFEVDEAEADKVIKALNRTRWNGRKISVEPAGEADENTGRKKAERKTEKPERKKAEKPAKEPRCAKPSREERGYTKPRGRKDDWKQFFQHDNGLKGPEPDFSEEGWAKPSKKKKK